MSEFGALGFRCLVDIVLYFSWERRFPLELITEGLASENDSTSTRHLKCRLERVGIVHLLTKSRWLIQHVTTPLHLLKFYQGPRKHSRHICYSTDHYLST